MIYEFLTDGFEDMEAIAPIDILRRAGVGLQTVGVGVKTVTSKYGIAMACDITEDEIDMPACEGVILPGGPGHKSLARSGAVLRLLADVNRRGGLLAAICASPSILGTNGYLKGKRACCFPSFESQLLGAQVIFDPVVTDGSVITSRGAGTATEFALALVAYLVSPEKAAAVAAEIQRP